MKATALPLLLLAAAASSVQAQNPVFQTDFDTTIPPEIQAGTATLTGVQGYQGLGTRSSFDKNFLRSTTGNAITLTLQNLPTHRTLSIDVLFAAIDSLDGVGNFPAGDWLRITLDGKTVFHEAFANATPTQVQTYAPPAGVVLARRVDLGFAGPGSFFTDSAYDLGADPFLRELPHTASSAKIVFLMEGAVQGLHDESWALDNLRVRVGSGGGTVLTPYGTSCGPVLAATGTPRPGNTLRFRTTSMHASTTAAFLGLGVKRENCPLDADGMPSCWLLHDFALVGDLQMAITAGTAELSLRIPSDSALAFVELFAQSWTTAPSANAAGLQASGALRIQIGAQISK